MAAASGLRLSNRAAFFQCLTRVRFSIHSLSSAPIVATLAYIQFGSQTLNRCLWVLEEKTVKERERERERKLMYFYFLYPSVVSSLSQQAFSPLQLSSCTIQNSQLWKRSALLTLHLAKGWPSATPNCRVLPQTPSTDKNVPPLCRHFVHVIQLPPSTNRKNTVSCQKTRSLTSTETIRLTVRDGRDGLQLGTAYS